MHTSILISQAGWLRRWQALLSVTAVLVLSLALQHEVLAEVGISEFDQAKALEMMRSADAESRAVAYRACRKLGASWKPSYRAMLEKALASHQQKILDSVDLATEEANRFSGTLLKLRQQRDFAVEYTLTDLRSERASLADLQRAHADARLWFREAKAQHGRAAASMAVLSDSSTAIDEIRRELGYCAGKVAVIAPRTFNRVLSKYSTQASNLHDRLGEQVAFQRRAQLYAKAVRLQPGADLGIDRGARVRGPPQRAPARARPVGASPRQAAGDRQREALE